jgi:hypothetical protein
VTFRCTSSGKARVPRRQQGRRVAPPRQWPALRRQRVPCQNVEVRGTATWSRDPKGIGKDAFAPRRMARRRDRASRRRRRPPGAPGASGQRTRTYGSGSTSRGARPSRPRRQRRSEAERSRRASTTLDQGGAPAAGRPTEYLALCPPGGVRVPRISIDRLRDRPPVASVAARSRHDTLLTVTGRSSTASGIASGIPASESSREEIGAGEPGPAKRGDAQAACVPALPLQPLESHAGSSSGIGSSSDPREAG